MFDASNTPARFDVASDDLFFWSNVGDNLSGDVYSLTLAQLSNLVFAQGTSSALGSIGYITGSGGAVTQITSAATGVTLSKPTGRITTFALTTAAAAEEVFVVTNTLVAATDVVVVSTTYAGAGTPLVAVRAVAAGSFTVVITNLHASAALDALMILNFAVIKGAIA